MAKHFKLTNETKVNVFGVTLFRIECTIDCKWAKVGDKGGWVEKEDNLDGSAWVSGSAEVFGSARVSDEARVFGSAWVSGSAEVFGSAWVSGSAWVFGSARVFGSAWVSDEADYCCFQSFGSRYDTTTVFREKDGNLRVRCGCFNGTLEEFAAKVQLTHGDSKHGKVYKAIIEVIKLRFNVQ